MTIEDSMKNDGGPAFPHPPEWDQMGGSLGMTLRDYYAGEALSGALANQFNRPFFAADHTPRLARDCYAIADAMLEARK